MAHSVSSSEEQRRLGKTYGSVDFNSDVAPGSDRRPLSRGGNLAALCEGRRYEESESKDVVKHGGFRERQGVCSVECH